MTTSTMTAIRRPSASSAEDAPPVPVEFPVELLAELLAEAPAELAPAAGDSGADDVVDIWGHGSFPASDPPANW